MKNCGLLLTVICGLGLVGGCGGGGSSMSLVTTHPVSPLVITSSAPPAGTAGTAYGGSGSFMFSASGGVAPYSWSWAAVSGSSLPSGLNLTSSGEISGTPTTAGTYNVTVTVTDSEVPPTKTSANYSIMIASPVAPLQITSGDPVQGQVGVVYGTAHRLRDNFGRFVTLTFFQLTSTGGNGSITWTWAAGASVPPGLSCCVRFFPTGPFPLREGIFVRGEISGLPTTPGKFNVVVTATDSSSPPLTATGNYTITIAPPPPPVVNTTPPLPVGTLKSPYVGYTFTASEGFPPFTWSETGALPAGMTLGSGGVLSGTPTEANSFPISVVVTDSLGRKSPAQKFTLQVLSKGFVPTGSMAVARQLHTATLLNTGKVLVVGGGDASAELYDASSGTFSLTGSMQADRNTHTATLLSSGKVLIAGGNSGAANLNTAELYDPTTGKFNSTGSMTSGHASHTATLLSTGKVLIAGGLDSTGVPTATAELFDPSTGTFAAIGSMSTPRSSHSATLLGNGTVLIAGGMDATGNPLSTAELFDPSTRTFKATAGSMVAARLQHTATMLSSGKVLLTGGLSFGGAVNTAELFDPSTGTFTATGNMDAERTTHTATLLADGTVLIAGGLDLNSNLLSGAEVFDVSTKAFTPTADMTAARASHTATLLGDGNVLVTGGHDSNGNSLATAELHQ